MPNLIFENSETEIIGLIEAKNKGLHKTLTGRFVKLGSPECGKDIQKRIADITHHRDMSPHRSDARIYYTGLLRVLGRQLRENERIMASRSVDSTKDKKNQKKLTESSLIHQEKLAARIMKLAGLS